VRDVTAKRTLARAFQNNTSAADSLEKFFRSLLAEVCRLKFELARLVERLPDQPDE
jgi:hypothetical protein